MENQSPTINFTSETPDYEAKICLNILIHRADIKTYASKPDFENITPSKNTLSATAQNESNNAKLAFNLLQVLNLHF